MDTWLNDTTENKHIQKEKTCSNNVFYTSYLAGKDINGYYPYSANQVFTMDKKGRLYFSGDDSCFLTFQHKTGKDCSHNKKCREKLVDEINSLMLFLYICLALCYVKCSN